MKSCCLLFIGSLLAHAQVNILTANGNNFRNNANLQEYQLSPATVSGDGFGKVGVYPVDGQVYAQPLYVSAVATSAGSRNLVVVATMHDSVYAFDADAAGNAMAAPLWKVSLGASVPAQMLFGTPYGDIANEVGVLGTGAISLDKGILFVVAASLFNGIPVYTLHALDLASGEERLNGPVPISANAQGSGGTVEFVAGQHLQRPGLLLANGSVYVAFGSHGDQAPWHGWIISYDATDLSHQNGAFLSTASGNGGAIWQSGRGIAADAQGTMYAVTGNGDYDGVQNFSQSFLRLSGAAPAISGWYTPANWQSMSDADFDLSAGPALVSTSNTLLGADKGGQLYVIDGKAMGQNPAPDSSPASLFQISSGSIFNMAVWEQPGGALVYTQGGQDPLRCWRLTGSTLNPTPVTSSSFPLPYSRIGMTVSADGANLDSGIVWETNGNYNDDTQPGILHAFKASDLSVELWNSNMNPNRDAMGAVAKFASPTVANGRVYVATFANRVEVYGVLDAGVADPAITTVGGAASYVTDAVSAGELVSIFGSNLGPAQSAGLTLDTSGMVATDLATTRVLFDGVPAPLTYASSTQLNAIVPFSVTSPSTHMVVEYQGQPSVTVDLAVAVTTPGIFTADGSGTGPAIALNQDGTVNSVDNPAPAGSVVTFYATGVGALAPAGPDGSVVTADALPLPVQPVMALVGGAEAQVLYAGGAPGMVLGILQVNVQIPVSTAPGSVPLVLQAAGRYSQDNVTVAVAGGAPATNSAVSKKKMKRMKRS